MSGHLQLHYMCRHSPFHVIVWLYKDFFNSFCNFYPQYFTFSVMLSMIGCAVFLQLSTVHKFSMLALMSTIYVVIIRVVYKDLFDDHDSIHFCRYVVSSSGSLRGVVTQQYGSLFFSIANRPYSFK